MTTESHPKVLIVEDDKMNSYFFEITLQRRGPFATAVTENVDEIVRMAGSNEVDLILLDVSLSNSRFQGEKVDGISIAKILKSNPATRSVPILLATAHAMKGDRENFLKESGAEDYISKPITDPKALIEKVKTLLRAAGKPLPPAAQ